MIEILFWGWAIGALTALLLYRSLTRRLKPLPLGVMAVECAIACLLSWVGVWILFWIVAMEEGEE